LHKTRLLQNLAQEISYRSDKVSNTFSKILLLKLFDPQRLVVYHFQFYNRPFLRRTLTYSAFSSVSMHNDEE